MTIPESLVEYKCPGGIPRPCASQGMCLKKCPGTQLACTKPKGHDGPHVACGFKHNLAIWDEGNIRWICDEYTS